MPRTVPLVAGLIVVSAVTYKFRDDILKDTHSIQQQLQSARASLDHITSSTSTQSLLETPHESILPPFTLIDDSKDYVSKRLVPSGKEITMRVVKVDWLIILCFLVKHSWNSQVTGMAHGITNADYYGMAKQAWEKVKDSVQ